ncbi:MAG TPA: PqqD family protein [Terriglobales bacterium]|jgi:carbamoylphosphate synthase large subunit|nr:PqqD family protein [Terriglobales bacterium]
MELYVRSDTVVSRVIAGEVLIVPISKGVGDLASIYSLNPVASAIWEAISCPRSLEEIDQMVAEEFEAESERIAYDVKVFLAEMESVGLVMEVGVAA